MKKKSEKKLSHYANYVKERLGKEIMENEKGFAQYSFGPDYLFIEEMYVDPEFRETEVATQMADELCNIALKNDKPYLLATVAPKALNSTESMKVILSYGFVIRDIDPSNNAIILTKKIES